MIVFGSKISYFTGKFEAYLRWREIDYEFRPLDSHLYRSVVPGHLGATQFPSVELDDGRWMSDTTPMIAWLEQDRTGPAVIPADPVQRYLSLLIEDYADEWLWRPAMYYRWSFAPDRYLAGTRLAEEIITIPGVPLAERRRWVTRRQKRLFVSGDGVDKSNREHVESSYLNLLDWLEAIFIDRPFMLGDRPTISDFGLMGPFFRHFVHDPTPAQLMQERAPAVFEWVARTWNARVGRLGDESLVTGIPDDWAPLLKEIGQTHLEALAQNAIAFTAGEKRHDLQVQGVTYRGIPTSAYRTWCLKQLQTRFQDLPEDAAGEVREILERHGCWEPLWRVTDFRSGHDPEGTAPFCQATRMVRD
ncbi:MAG: glutathione S-transferase family protein [Solirubrobacterales bacterium]